jgi:2-dehydro-3-deoxygluconokinase
LQPELICIGEPMVELNQTRPGEPNYLFGHGGDTSNAAIAAARQGAKVGYLTALGQDAFGQSFISLWQQEGVDSSRVRRLADAHTAIYFVTHGPQGHEFSYLRSGSAASRIGPDDVPRDYVAASRILHASGISQAISTSACDAVLHAVEIARDAGVLVSYDTNLRRRLWPLARARAISNATAALADFALPSLDDAQALTGIDEPDGIVDFYLRQGSPVVVLKMGAEGAIVATADRRVRLEPHTVEAVDATGAGDTFVGAFLADYLRHGDPFAAARWGNAAAAVAVTGFGAVAPMPTRDAVAAFLDGSGR